MTNARLQSIRAAVVASWIALAVAAGAVPAAAVDLDTNRPGLTCPDGVWMELWLLNTQVPKGSPLGEAWVEFSDASGAVVGGVGGGMAPVGQRAQEFGAYVAIGGVGPWTLSSASTTLPGRLVLTKAVCLQHYP